MDLEKQAEALAYVPCILARLDADTFSMFAVVLQATRDGGYEDGFRDGVLSLSRDSDDAADHRHAIANPQ